MTGSIAIAVSGGVDSLVSAYLLKEKGLSVFGIHFLSGYEGIDQQTSTAIQDLCRQVDLPLVIVDLREPFRSKVVDYFSAAYRMGKTPNPCLVCNPEIKFGDLLEKARQLGASKLATGHYARVERASDGRARLFKGLDRSKDQSYFLSRLTQNQLARACFPLGAWTKQRVRLLAAEKGLRPLNRRESQDVCFIKEARYADFLVQALGVHPRPGDIVDSDGRRVGTHEGLHRYTVGQRRGINCPSSQAYYVLGLDSRNNRLVVGFKDQQTTGGCSVTDVNWIAGPPDGPLSVHTRIRYRHRPVPAMVTPIGPDRADIRFEQPQMAVAPGQGAAFYRGDEVIGGGWIEGQ